MYLKFSKYLFILILIWTYSRAIAEETASEENYFSYLNILGDQNRVHPLENAGSHGFEGWRMGGGFSRVEVPKQYQNSLTKDWNQPKNKNINEWIVPKFWLTKGLMYPWDIGLTYMASPMYQFSHLGTYLQWTIFEEFAMPALAVRITYSRLFGMQVTTLTTSSASFVLSYGMGPLTAYTDIGLYRHFAKEHSTETYGEYYWLENISSIGLQWQIFAPFIASTIEANFRSSTLSTIQTKISIGI